MTKEMERLKEINARKAELRKEIADGHADAERLAVIKQEAEGLSNEEAELRSKMELDNLLEGTEPVEGTRTQTAEKSSAQRFVETGRMSIPLFREERALLVSTGNLAEPTAVSTEIGQLPPTVSSIIDDVTVLDATGTGSWKFPYADTAATAADVTEGSKIGGTAGTFNFVEISPKTWGVLTSVSNQIAQMTPVNYAAAVQTDAYLALRKKAKEEVTAAVIASPIIQKVPNIKLDQDFLRTIVLGYDSDESVASGTKLYINKKDLMALGKVRGTQDKKPVYKITFTDENNGTIEEGGTIVKFSINSSVPAGKQLYGQPKNVKLLLWGKYEVKTDEGGDYFDNNLMGIRGLASAGAGLAVKNGMQLIAQGALE